MMAVPQAISNLQLRRAFRGYAAELMDCVETRSDAVVYVIDDNDRGISCFAGAEAGGGVVWWGGGGGGGGGGGWDQPQKDWPSSLT